ncbi:MAG: hypothetical protein MAG715_00537 [Methanonatronarchaeales archaeon]|nr:hypothetical protein [Methanonatronarchaeales archaeon]
MCALQYNSSQVELSPVIGGCDRLLPNGACALLNGGEDGESPGSAGCPLIRGNTCVKRLESPPGV